LQPVTGADLAKILGVTRSTVTNLAVDGVLPKVGRGLFDVPTCVQGYMKHRERLAGGDDPAATSLTAERSRLARLKADQAEREARIRAGELIEVRAIVPAWLAVANTVRTRMLAIPTRLATRMVGLKTAVEVESTLRKEIHAALAELATIPRV
jgi:phage terminase Nu1 subunit (DNA packaging protein)